MKKLKSISSALFCLALSVGFVSNASAQLPGNISVPGKATNTVSSVQAKVQQMKEKLNLSDIQVSRITAIYHQADKKISDLKKSGMDPKALASQTKDINNGADSKVEALLSPDQQAKWKAMKAKL